jgi:hypothetical protein
MNDVLIQSGFVSIKEMVVIYKILKKTKPGKNE